MPTVFCGTLSRTALVPAYRIEVPTLDVHLVRAKAADAIPASIARFAQRTPTIAATH